MAKLNVNLCEGYWKENITQWPPKIITQLIVKYYGSIITCIYIDNNGNINDDCKRDYINFPKYFRFLDIIKYVRIDMICMFVIQFYYIIYDVIYHI